MYTYLSSEYYGGVCGPTPVVEGGVAGHRGGRRRRSRAAAGPHVRYQVRVHRYIDS